MRENFFVSYKVENDDSILKMVFNLLKCKDLVMLFVFRVVMFVGNIN